MTGVLNDLPYDYVARIDYDYFEQRTYLVYGNRTETFYNYTPALRRLGNLKVKTADGIDLFNNRYGYDKTGNVLGLINSAGVTANNMAGHYNHNFEYDNLNRLVKANGNFEGSNTQIPSGNDGNSKYTLNLKYNDTHGITYKAQEHTKNGNTFVQNSYVNSYKYINNTHKVDVIGSDNGDIEKFTYDLNGNIIKRKNNASNRDFLWDESNRLRVVADSHSMQHYIYDASGDRILKANSDQESVYENGTLVNAPGTVSINGYTSYPSAFMVVNADGVYSKHYYVGSQRIVSRLGDTDASIFDVGCPTCKPTESKNDFDDKKLQQAQKDDLQNYATLAKKGIVRYKEYKLASLEDQQKALDEENKTDDDATFRAPPTPIYFYHPDHLGTSTALTDFNGKAYQFFLNLPFGETMAQQLGSNYYNTQYKFNGKELDEETGFYYYGARYYDARVSIWQSVDPRAADAPGWSPYRAFFCNPIRYTDPDGQWEWDATGNLVAQKGDNSYSMAKFLGTSQSNSMQMLNRGGVTANAKGVLNLKEGQSFAKDNLWVGTKSASGPVVNNSDEATSHYFNGNGQAADVGNQSTRELLGSPEFQTKHKKITSEEVQPTGNFAVDLTGSTFHIGRTKVDYSVSGNGNSSSVNYKLFSGDGFWDPNFVAEKTLGKVFDGYKPDGKGPNLETPGGTPYDYKTRERTFFFKPVEVKK